VVRFVEVGRVDVEPTVVGFTLEVSVVEPLVETCVAVVVAFCVDVMVPFGEAVVFKDKSTGTAATADDVVLAA
jgi:hypothetical protein